MTSHLPAAPDAASSVKCWREGAVARIRFNRPEALNAIDVTMARAFRRACEAVTRDADVRALWIDAAGSAFMAGGDLAAMATDPQAVANELIAGMHEGLMLLADAPWPVIASVHGAVAGGGLGLMLGCDLVFAAEGTRLAIAYPLVGASSDCSTTWSLTHMVGIRKAMEIVLMAERIDAGEALRLGLVNRVLPEAELEPFTRSFVERLADGPSVALGRLKRLVRAAPLNDLRTHLAAEAEGFAHCAGTRDFREGVAAFLGKRPPRFEGR